MIQNEVKRIIVSLILILLLLPPVFAANNADDEMLRKANNLKLDVPEKGNSVLGTQGSMFEMCDWLMDCSRALITFFNDTMDMLGLSDTPYVKNMNKAFDIVMKDPPSVKR